MKNVPGCPFCRRFAVNETGNHGGQRLHRADYFGCLMMSCTVTGEAQSGLEFVGVKITNRKGSNVP